MSAEHPQHRITFRDGVAPNDDYDLIVTSTDSSGNVGELNKSVLETLQVDPGLLAEKQILSQGFGLLPVGSADARLGVVVTVSASDNTATLLRKNLLGLLGLLEREQQSLGRDECSVWLPLMGTGAGDLSLSRSLELTVAVLELAGSEWKHGVLRIDLAVPQMEDKEREELRGMAQELFEQTGFVFEESPPDAPEVPPPETRKHWILQAVPNQYDLRNEVVVGESTAWRIVSHAAEIEPGDRVFLWLAKGSGGKRAVPGIYGVAEVTAAAYVDPDQRTTKSQRPKTQYRLPIRFLERVDPPLTGAVIAESGELPDFKMLGPAQGASFRVSDPERDVILRLLGAATSHMGFVVAETDPGFHDDNPALEDALGFEPIALALEAFLKDRKRTRLPLTIAIDGPWGSGKSSLMKMLRNLLQVETPDRTRVRSEDKDAPPSPGMGTVEFAKELFLALFPLRRPRKKARRSTDPIRSFETVYFNAWRHGAGTRLTASLVHKVLRDLRESWGPRFVFQLGLRRVNRGALWRLLLETVTTNVAWLLVLAALAAALTISGLQVDTSGKLSELPALSFGGGLWLLFLHGLLTRAKKGPPKLSLAQFIQTPDYESLLGAEHDVEEDFRRILNTLHTDYHCDLAIFIDDLDRCSPSQVGEVVEVLNVFFGQEKLNCLFVLGMHRDMVAASLELAYPDLAKLVEEKPSLENQRPFGRRFLEKIAQFVIHLPEPEDEDIDRYIAKLTGLEKREVALDIVRQAEQLEEKLAGKDSTPEDLARAEKFRADLGGKGISATQLEDARQSYREVQEKLAEAAKIDERDPVAHEVFDRVRFALGKNPRQYKRFFNTLRFENFLMTSAGKLRPGTAAEQLLPVAIQAALTVEYPDIAAFVRRVPFGLAQITTDADDIASGGKVGPVGAGEEERQQIRGQLRADPKLRDLLLLDASEVSDAAEASERSGA